MTNMQFRSYIFPHNPASITISEGNHIVSYFCPGAGEVRQNLGAKSRTVTCKGAFFADSYAGACLQMEQFRAVSKDGAAGILLLPGMPPFAACLSELQTEAQGDGCIIPYTMVFTEVTV